MCNGGAGPAVCPARQTSTRARIFTILIGLLFTGGPRVMVAEAPFWPRFHGPKGDNISTETGLLKKWPAQGPKLLWTAKGIGRGVAGVTIADGRIYTAGDTGDDLVIFALDMDGTIRRQA